MPTHFCIGNPCWICFPNGVGPLMAMFAPVEVKEGAKLTDEEEAE